MGKMGFSSLPFVPVDGGNYYPHPAVPTSRSNSSLASIGGIPPLLAGVGRH